MSQREIEPLRPTESMDEYIRFYDAVGRSGIESRVYTTDGTAIARFRRVFEVIRRHITVDGCSLDIGCYDGAYARLMALQADSVVALDISQSAMSRGRDEISETSCSIEWVKGDAQALPFEPCSFDFILFSETLEHLERPTVALAECSRVLSRDGTMVVTVPNAGVVRSMSVLDTIKSIVWNQTRGESDVQRNVTLEGIGISHDGYLHRSYTARQLVEMAKNAGFEVISLETCAPQMPKSLNGGVLDSFDGFYFSVCRLLRFVPLIRGLGIYIIVILRKA